MAIKDEDKAIEAIMQCLEESKIYTDDSKKASIIANYRTLQHTLRRGKTATTSPLTHSNVAAVKNTCFNPSSSINSAINQQYFSSQSDKFYETPASISTISRPPPGLSPGYVPVLPTNVPTTIPPVAFDDELLEQTFESYFFRKTRSSEFSWIGRHKV